MREKILQLIKEELERARSKFPRPQSSAHEGYAVLLEEWEEFQEMNKAFDGRMASLWDAVKKNKSEAQLNHLNAMQEIYMLLIIEAVQTAAMVDRYRRDIFFPHLSESIQQKFNQPEGK